MIENRKQNLISAKKSIQDELYGRLDQLLAEKEELIDRMDKEEAKVPLTEDLGVVLSKIDDQHRKISEWNLSRKSKARKSIEWIDERTKKETRLSAKPRKKINWEVASEVSSQNKSIKKNNSSWLEEGVMVVHKDDRKCLNPMMVIDVYNEGEYSRVLRGGDVAVFRSLSLRPYDDD